MNVLCFVVITKNNMRTLTKCRKDKENMKPTQVWDRVMKIIITIFMGFQFVLYDF